MNAESESEVEYIDTEPTMRYVSLHPSDFISDEVESPLQRLQRLCVHDWLVDFDGVGVCRRCALEGRVADILKAVEEARVVAAHEALRSPLDVVEVVDLETGGEGKSDRRKWGTGKYARAHGRQIPGADEPDTAAGETNFKERNGVGNGTTAVDLVGRQFTDYGRQIAQKRFLEAYREYGTVRAGLGFAQVSRATFAKWHETDLVFRALFEEAQQDYNDKLKGEVHRRAVEGVRKEHRSYFRGELVDQWHELEYSDNLLMFQVKSRMPEYRDKVDANGEGKGAQIPWEALRDLWSEDRAPVGPARSAALDGDGDEEPAVESADVVEVLEGEYAFTDVLDAMKDNQSA